jgi:hypothetical protein
MERRGEAMKIFPDTRAGWLQYGYTTAATVCLGSLEFDATLPRGVPSEFHTGALLAFHWSSIAWLFFSLTLLPRPMGIVGVVAVVILFVSSPAFFFQWRFRS